MLVTSENWWAKTEWTDEHYKLARRLMRGIHVLPQIAEMTLFRKSQCGTRKRGTRARAEL